MNMMNEKRQRNMMWVHYASIKTFWACL